MKKLVLTVVAIFTVTLGFAQDDMQKAADLKSQLGPKNDSIAAIQGRLDAIQGQIDALPGWKKGMFGTIGANLSGSNNWYSQAAPNNSSGNIGIAVNGFANLDREKFFWRNSANVNLQWVKFQDKDAVNPGADADKFNPTTDAINAISLYGYKLSDKFAISALGEYRSTISNFNDPGYLDFGIGATWTPITDLVVVIHPLNYNFIFAKDDAAYESSTGAKIVVDYTRQIGAVNFKTNFSTFQSYKSGDLSNWTWVNSFGYTLWKGIGLGFEFGLRNNKQESFASAPGTAAVLADVDVKTQSYWLFGLNYSL